MAERLNTNQDGTTSVQTVTGQVTVAGGPVGIYNADAQEFNSTIVTKTFNSATVTFVTGSTTASIILAENPNRRAGVITCLPGVNTYMMYRLGSGTVNNTMYTGYATTNNTVVNLPAGFTGPVCAVWMPLTGTTLGGGNYCLVTELF